MTRLSFLGVLAIGVTLVAAPTASAKPVGAVSFADNVAAVNPAGHAPAQRCAHNGPSLNKAGHLNCRHTNGAASAGTGDTPPVFSTSTGDGNPTAGPPSTTSGGDQGSASGDQGDQNDQGSSSGDQGSASGDQGDQNDQGDQGSSSGDQGGQNGGQSWPGQDGSSSGGGQGSWSGGDNQQ